MDIGAKIKQLRYKAGMTQEQLAERLGVTAQSVSKWENAASMPDVMLLPAIAGEFGVTVDELFDLSAEQRFDRIERRMEVESELPGELFLEYEEFLKTKLGEYKDRRRVLSLLANLYHHRMESDSRKVSRYAREAIGLAPGVKDCQWLLAKAEGAAVWDWNVSNRSRVIDFYKQIVDGGEKSPLAYYCLIDQLLADRRAKEAERYIDECEKLPGAKDFLITVYRAHAALCEFDEKRADEIIAEGMKKYAGDPGFLFEAAQYHASKCEYAEAIECYEASYAAEEERKPRFTDALEGIAMIYEITGEYEKAAGTYDRIIENMQNEWGFTDEYCVADAKREKQRLLQKMNNKRG